MEKILSAGRKGLSYQKLAVGKDARKELDGILKQLRNEGQIVARGEQLTAVKALGFVPATITRVSLALPRMTRAARFLSPAVFWRVLW